MASLEQEIKRIKTEIDAVGTQKREKLRTMDLYCIDNSLRESTVGQLRSHTLEDKQAIYKEVKKVGIPDKIIASFAHMTRVDDDFCQWLIDSGEDMDGHFSFSEVTGKIVDGAYDTETVPVTLQKNKKYGIYNTFFEVDVASENIDWEEFTVDDLCKLIFKWIKWVHDNHPGKNIRNIVNLRDLPFAMATVPRRLLYVVQFLAQLPKPYQMFGLAFEDAFGEYLPEELEAWSGSVRRVMDSNGWAHGKLVVHIHEKWDLQTAAQLDCLSGGCDGVWASLCEEGAMLGHACSTVTMMNLIRMGNEKVMKKYNCKYLREAAVNVTKITTGKPPRPKAPVYGARAADLVFGFLGVGEFDVAAFFGVEAPTRITTLADPQMIVDRLEDCFGKNENFTIDIGGKMKKQLMEDLRSGRKEEYMSKVGIAMLFDRSGGKLTPEMAKSIAKDELENAHHEDIIQEIRKYWDHWDSKELEAGDDCLSFDSFYHGFMAPYFGCYRCPDTRRAFKAIDMDSDLRVHWNEFMVYVKWALREYPQTATASDVIEIAFQKGLIPAMRDEKLKNRDHYKHSSFRFGN